MPLASPLTHRAIFIQRGGSYVTFSFDVLVHVVKLFWGLFIRELICISHDEIRKILPSFKPVAETRFMALTSSQFRRASERGAFRLQIFGFPPSNSVVSVGNFGLGDLRGGAGSLTERMSRYLKLGNSLSHFSQRNIPFCWSTTFLLQSWVGHAW